LAVLHGQKADHCVCIDVFLYCAMHVGVCLKYSAVAV